VRYSFDIMFFVFAFFALFQSASICDKYSKALNLTNLKLVTTVVSGTVGKVTASGTNTLKYFDGTKPAGSTNFLDAKNAASLKALSDSLVSFFGGALGCTDGTITAYTGPTLAKVHSKMGISGAEFDFFNSQVIVVLAGAGVSGADQTAVLSVLESTRTDIVSQTICDRYSRALKLTNKQLVTTVVTGTFGKITAATSIILKYFNGVKPAGSTDYINRNKNALPGLVNGLVTFFGGALGCGDGTIPKYAGATLKQVHSRMGINVDEFNFFNQQLLAVLRGAGVVLADVRAVDGVLNGTKGDIVA